MSNPLYRTTALETHPSWKAHDMKHDADMATSYEGYAAMELTGGFGPDAPDAPELTDDRSEYDSAGALERGVIPCHHSPYWESVSDEAEARFSEGEDAARFMPPMSEGEQAAHAPMSDAQATEDARNAAPGYFRHP